MVKSHTERSVQSSLMTEKLTKTIPSGRANEKVKIKYQHLSSIAAQAYFFNEESPFALLWKRAHESQEAKLHFRKILPYQWKGWLCTQTLGGGGWGERKKKLKSQEQQQISLAMLPTRADICLCIWKWPCSASWHFRLAKCAQVGHRLRVLLAHWKRNEKSVHTGGLKIFKHDD